MELMREITRLKYQELTPQIRCERAEFEQLIVNSKTKVGRSFERVVDLLLEAQKQICEIEPESNEHYQVKGQLIAYQIILENNLTKDELQSLLTRQNELHQLEKHLLSLQMMNN
ncbi:hypothetical protein G9A89_004075 [Geosiphon pyriformis]|nr:hypothetical protein G9A89_004075 [Geosiphon pyriformis]